MHVVVHVEYTRACRVYTCTKHTWAFVFARALCRKMCDICNSAPDFEAENAGLSAL